MRYIADFHIHSKYSRATSSSMDIDHLFQWAGLKGIQILGTGDFTHPLWFKELEEKLDYSGNGLYQLKNKPRDSVFFILTTEISCIYKKGDKTRRIHLLVFAPNLNIVKKLNQRLEKNFNLHSDGRPILGIDAKELLKIILDVSKENFVVPAHCLLPNTIIHTKNELLKPIQDIRQGDFVLTHKNRWCRVKKVFKRFYHGKVYDIKPRNFSLGLTTTSEHPFYAIKTHKNCHWSNGICKPPHANLDECKKKYFKKYKPQWLMASQLERGDVLIFPRFINVFNGRKEIDLEKIISQLDIKTKLKGEFIAPVGNRGTAIKKRIIVDKNFCRLAGYYLAEGYLNSRDLIGFAFSSKEKNYVEEVIDLMKKVFGFNKKPKLKISKSGGLEILFYSKILFKIFQRLFYSPIVIRKNANSKALPIWTLGLPLDLQVEIFRCWWRGDKGYTASRLLMNQMKIILLKLGIVPSIYVDKRDSYNSRPKHFIEKRKIKARYDMYSLNRLSFYEDRFNLLEEAEFTEVAQYNKGKKYGWIDNNYIYLPIYDIEIKDYQGEVYNLKVEEDNSYVCEFAVVHNCWTPWYAIFGSQSGFDSLKECFEELTPEIYALETGLSSDPEMNWRVSSLDRYTLISNSDAHSPENLGREANVFDFSAEEGEISYQKIIDSIKTKNNFKYTIEFFPEEGKYHFDGHRPCQISLSPEETRRYKGICPKCGRPLTIGVLHRVDDLSDRKEPIKPGAAPSFRSIIPFKEIIAQSYDVGKTSKKVGEEYLSSVKKVKGGEFSILLDLEERDLLKIASPRVAEGIIKARKGEITKKPGYDGIYGEIKVLFEKPFTKKLF